MRPVRLEMKGFSAFADLTVVDFEHVELLAFAGPTGSGKSSIIDAMTFALYGSVARYDQRAVAPVINQLSAEAKVKFEFDIGEQRYTAVRVVRRTKLGATTREARLECGGETIAGDEKELSAKVRELLGLDFGQFNKTVVLPQGKFSEFLHDTAANRQALLRELFGFGIYERMGRTARLNQSKMDARAEVLQGQIERMGDVSDEHVAELAAAVDELTALRAEVEASAQRAAAIDPTVVALRSEAATAERQLRALDDLDVPDGIDAVAARLTTTRTDLGSAEAAHVVARTQLTQACDDEESGPSASAMASLLERHRQLDRLGAQLSQAREAVVPLRAKCAEAETEAAEATAKITEADAAVAVASDGVRTAEANLAAAGDLAAARQLLLAHDQYAELGERRARLLTGQSAAQQAAVNAAGDRDRAAAGLADAQLLAPAALLAAHLHEGEPCPVCEQVVVAVPQQRADAGAALLHAQQALAAATKAFDAADRIARDADTAVVRVEAQLEPLRAVLVGSAARDETAALVELLVSLTGACDAARLLLQAAEASLARVRQDPATRAAIGGEAAAQHALRGAELSVESLARQHESQLEELVGQPAAELAEAALAQAQQLTSVRQEAERSEAAASRLEAQARAAVALAETAERSARASFDDARDRVADLKPPRTTASLADDWEALAAWADAQAAELETRAAKVQSQLAGAEAEQAALMDALRTRAGAEPGAGIEAIRGEVTERWSAARGELQHVTKERERARETMAEIGALREGATVAKALGDLLRANGFEQWLLEEALAELVERATARLRDLTSGAYSLTTDGSAFRIIDHRNADEVRDARSLSGGETFLTSLALALALAESSVDLSTEGTAPLESIFLDEGFGTLDPDTLDVVAGTIEELGASGRMVGIVTHIRELAERMPTRFEVTKTNSTSAVQRVDV